MALATATASLALALAPQDPVEAPAEDPSADEGESDLDRIFGNRPLVDDWVLAEEWQGLLGTWTLMEFDHVIEPMDSDDLGGYLHFGEGVLTMIIHVRNLETDDMPEFMAQAGVHRWHMVRDDILQTATMMGHSNMGPNFEWELPNTPREFRVELEGEGDEYLTLTRPDNSRLIFSKVRTGAFPLAAIDAIDKARAGLELDLDER